MISLINIDYENGESFEEEVEIMAADILCGKLYSCPDLKLGKGKSTGGDGKFEYNFDIFKMDKVLDHLIKDQQIWLKDGHKIPSPNELKGKKYCKWSNSYNHFTANCIVFQQPVQKALKKVILS